MMMSIMVSLIGLRSVSAGSPIEGFRLLGQGECRQKNGQYPLAYQTGFGQWDPHTESDNAAKATEKCQQICHKYPWCLAAQVTLRAEWPLPDCSLVTDRPTFEKYYGPNQDYSWGFQKVIDGVHYSTYCAGGNPACAAGNTLASDFNGGKLNPRSGYWCYINDSPVPNMPTKMPTAVPIPTPKPTIPAPANNGFSLLGQGECRQADGEYALEYYTVFGQFDPHTYGDNAAKSVEKCQAMCAQYPWCFAAEVALRADSPLPECSLITDRPTFEKYYGPNQDYSWAADKTIDGVDYYTLCNGGNPACAPGNSYSSNFNGGKLNPRKGYWCYINDSPVPNMPTKKPTAVPIPTPKPTIPAPADDGFSLLGQGECRQADGEYALEYNTGYYQWNPHTYGDNAAKSVEKCQETCAQYPWCLAAQVTLADIWPTPDCSLITDRPTFEKYYGPNQDYSWGAQKKIDGVQYSTYCNGGNPACAPGNSYSSNFNGGKLNHREGWWCYIKNVPNPDVLEQ